MPRIFGTWCSKWPLEEGMGDREERVSELNMIKNTVSSVAFLKGCWELFRGNASLFKRLFVLKSFSTLASSAFSSQHFLCQRVNWRCAELMSWKNYGMALRAGPHLRSAHLADWSSRDIRPLFPNVSLVHLLPQSYSRCVVKNRFLGSSSSDHGTSPSGIPNKLPR